MAIRIYSDLVERAVKRYGPNPALWIRRGETYQSWTYDQFLHSINQCADALAKNGFTRDSNAVVIGANTPEWIIAWHAIAFGGNCVVPTDPNLPVDEIVEILTRTKATAVFCDAAYLPLFDRLKKEHTFLKTVVVLTGSIPSAYDALPWDSFIQQGSADRSVFDRTFHPEDPIAILFTSGTTGRSKGAVLLQKNFCPTAEYAVAMMGATSTDRVLAVLPLYHVFGFASTIAGALLSGIDVVCIPEIRGPLITAAMNDLKVTALPAVPQMLTLILESIKRGASEKGAVVKNIFGALMNLSGAIKPIGGREVQRTLFRSVHEKFGGKFRLIVSGGASLDPKSFAAYQALGFDIVEGYGLTETMGPITLCPVTLQVQGSVGKVIGKNEMKIDNPDKLGWGEVLFRGDSVFQGYLDDPESTAKVFTADGWFRTGDRGRIDYRGMLFLSGRLKDVIVLDSGKNVYPDELEHYYESSSLIEEIGVFALAEKGRTAVSAVIVPVSTGRSGSREEIHEKIHREMVVLGQGRPDYKRVGSYAISDHPLPRTSTKKIKKHVLPKLYAQIKSGEHIPEPVPLTAVQKLLMESDRYRHICRCVQEIAPCKLTLAEMTPDRELLKDFGLDSLRMLDLAAMIESQIGVAVDQKALAGLVELEDFVQLVNQSGASGHAKSMKEILDEACKDSPCLFNDRKGTIITICLAAIKALSSLAWGFRIRGIDRIPADRPVIFAANHQSLFDGIWLYAALPGKIRKRTYAMVKVELTRAFFVKRLQAGINIVPVERDGDIITPLQKSYAALNAGKNIIIFPEGTRSVDGEIHDFRAGVGILMRESNVAVVPVRVINAAKKWPKGGKMQLFSGWNNRPELVFGNPVTLGELGFSSESDESVIAEAVRQQVASVQ